MNLKKGFTISVNNNEVEIAAVYETNRKHYGTVGRKDLPPPQIPVFEVVYMDGQQRKTVDIAVNPNLYEVVTDRRPEAEVEVEVVKEI